MTWPCQRDSPLPELTGTETLGTPSVCKAAVTNQIASITIYHVSLGHNFLPKGLAHGEEEREGGHITCCSYLSDRVM